ncbi:hypothetical protein [Amycolatopsis sp. CA-128772]|uniref:hypothetical protein n=1 Tax=Amycolatopsis sp. CA-128772 TaxID=2073159 RepID=UPI000CD2F47C|nr:hypothetical protein [Amycolatopsis sp. CA-128772]
MNLWERGKEAADIEKQRKADDRELGNIEMYLRSQEHLDRWAEALGATPANVKPVHRRATSERWNAGATKERIETTFTCEGRQFLAEYDGLFRVSLAGFAANTAADIGEAITRIEETERRADARRQEMLAKAGRRRKMLLFGGAGLVIAVSLVVVVVLVYQALTRLPIEYASGEKPDSRPCRADSCKDDGNFHWFRVGFSTTFTTTGEDAFRSSLETGPFCDLRLHWQLALDDVVWRSGDFRGAAQAVDLDVPLRGVREVTLTTSAPPLAPNCFPELSWRAKD